MAITNAIIQSRRGDEANFDPDQMRPGEWAVSLDTGYVRMCFAPGICVRMATYEGFEEDMKEVQLILATCQNIQTAVEKFETLAKQHANTAEEYSLESKSWAVGGTGTRDGEDTNNSKYHSEQAKSEADRAKKEADRAAGIAGIDVAKVGTPGIVAPDGKMINIDAQGNISTIYKNYRALNQIGLDDHTDYTCLEIATAMPDNSRIVLCPTDNVTPTTDIPGEKGLLIIERRNSYNAMAKYFSPSFLGSNTVLKTWTRFLQVQNQRDSEWDEELRSSRLVTNLLATEAGNPLDATMGKVLKDEVDGLSSKLTSKSYTFVNNTGYESSTVAIVKKNGFLYVKCHILVPVIEAWSAVTIGTVTDWDVGKVNKICVISSLYGATSANLGVDILADGTVQISTQGKNANSGFWAYGYATHVIS